jgi:hypothetical protein
MELAGVRNHLLRAKERLWGFPKGKGVPKMYSRFSLPQGYPAPSIPRRSALVFVPLAALARTVGTRPGRAPGRLVRAEAGREGSMVAKQFYIRYDVGLMGNVPRDALVFRAAENIYTGSRHASGPSARPVGPGRGRGVRIVLTMKDRRGKAVRSVLS